MREPPEKRNSRTARTVEKRGRESSRKEGARESEIDILEQKRSQLNTLAVFTDGRVLKNNPSLKLALCIELFFVVDIPLEFIRVIVNLVH